jgi:SNF2-related domain/Helicase conserved C-terminal domain
VAPEFQSKILSRSTTSDEYRIYRAALEWDLTDPIVIEGRDDFKSAKRWQERLTPYYHQVSNLITFCRRLPVTLLADDVGLGKTISAGLIVSELMSRSRVSKILIVAPKLLGPQWKEELESKFDIPAEIAIGKELITSDPDGVGAIITTYNTARLYLDALPEDRFQMLILDEAHKLRNLYGVEKTPQVAKRFRKALEDRRFRFVLMLTATPIQNRLWDLYSLVDLLSVARGHPNPFGTEGSFARRFIGDQRQHARQLRAEAREEFRSIVYGYMSRVRRGDAKLYFPERVVQMHRVDPTRPELELIRAIAKPIQKLNRLAQIGILQALTSSPDALMAQLAKMARNGTVPAELAESVKSIVTNMPPSAKLIGLGRLIEQLKKEDPERWRLVVFTTRRETQTTIQTFLESQGLKVGIINGDSGTRNQDTITRFRQNPPACRIIVSTEAGSEGVNLQVANLLVNFDLPWNPMIVEQRIGRVQRLASEHAHVSIFNIMLRGTFEEYIVGRLMEKLQMAAHAVGDIEALLQGSDIGDGDEDGTESFEDRILDLVLAALAGKDVEQDTRLAEKSIEEAKAELEREEATINSILGSMDGAEYVGPRAPTLPGIVRSMAPREFTLAALQTLGANITPTQPNLFAVEENGGREYIRFEDPAAEGVRSPLYAPGSAPFQRLVGRVVATGIHAVVDLDEKPGKRAEDVARQWVSGIGAKPKAVEIRGVRRSFAGSALLRVRATVVHDSYERLIEVNCLPEDHGATGGRHSALTPLPNTVEDPAMFGLDVQKLTDAASLDEAISEFCRFYLERREQETQAAGGDQRKRAKLHDEFTPRLSATLVGLEGSLFRDVTMTVRYAFETGPPYESVLTVTAHNGKMIEAPEIGLCSKSGRKVPAACLAKCAITGAEVLRHLLVESEISQRLGLPEFGVRCSMSGKRVLNDEVEASSVTGKLVASALLKTSALSGKRAEPEHFGICAFTNADLLNTELALSDISGKRYRTDDQVRSAVSGKAGHKQEFIFCHESRQPIAPSEAEPCEVSGKRVRPGVLARCEVTGKRVLPSELERCTTTGKRALKSLFVTSSLSQTRILEDAAIRSSRGTHCSPTEAQTCLWSGRKSHPDDLRVCELTGLPIHFEHATGDHAPRLRPLSEMLDGMRRTTDETQLWDSVAPKVSSAVKGAKCRVEAATLSPTKTYLATCSEARTLMGIRVRQVGAVYDLNDTAIVGRLAVGKRGRSGWTAR